MVTWQWFISVQGMKTVDPSSGRYTLSSHNFEHHPGQSRGWASTSRSLCRLQSTSQQIPPVPKVERLDTIVHTLSPCCRVAERENMTAGRTFLQFPIEFPLSDGRVSNPSAGYQPVWDGGAQN